MNTAIPEVGEVEVTKSAMADDLVRLCACLEARGYEIDGSRFQVGRPDRHVLPIINPEGRRLAAKYYPAGGAEAAFANLKKLWNSPFGSARKHPGLPEPVSLLPDLSLVLTERIDARPLAEFSTIPQSALGEAILLAADLHRSGVRPEKSRSARKIVRSVQRKADRVACLAPEHGEAVGRVVLAMKRPDAADSELVPCHGDFSPRNVLLGNEGMVLIDFDRLQWADPTRDVAHFGAWAWAWAVRNGRPPSWDTLDSVVELYRRLRPEAKIDRQLGFHIAAGLLRICCSIVDLSPQDAACISILLDEALRHVE